MLATPVGGSHPARLREIEPFGGCPAFVLDVPETIPELGYGTHQFFRYYGKFPSVVGGEILRRFPGHGPVLDCYAGSGTTLVEAQIAGRPSLGIDLNPLAVLAANVKTRYYDRDRLAGAATAWLAEAQTPTTTAWPPPDRAGKLAKWFSAEAADQLGRLRAALAALPEGPERDFLTVALLAVVRRCSKAHDGEVRPHIKAAKEPPPPVAAVANKVATMLEGLAQLDTLRPPGVAARAWVGDSGEAAAYEPAGPGGVELVIAHPPYLNSFNYLQVYGLELLWATGLGDLWQGWQPGELRAREHRAWPATDATLTQRYYRDVLRTLRTAADRLTPGGTLAVVVGDATIRGVLEPVHRVLWERLCEAGLEPVETWFRTTHYGIGKYAYRHRADYHGAADKRDAILFFQTPAQSGSQPVSAKPERRAV